MPRLSARLHLLGLIAAAVIPVWLFAAYLLAQYASHERERFGREAMQVARQVSLVVEADLSDKITVLEGLSKSSELANGDLGGLHAEALRLVQGTDRIIVLRDLAGHQLLNTRFPYGTALPPAASPSTSETAKLRTGRPLISDVHVGLVSNEYRITVELPTRGPKGEDWILAVSMPTGRIRDIMIPAVPPGWTVGIGDRGGAYVARSKLHDEMTGKPGLPEYLAKVVGRAGTFTSRNFQGATLLAGYYRSEFSEWFYTANVPLSEVQAPFWDSLTAIGAIGLFAMAVSAALAYVVGQRLASAARGLAARANALGGGRPVMPMSTTVTEFAVIAEALIEAERALAERKSELEAVLDTAPVAVWFTYDPKALEVIRNRFAAELMGLPTDDHKTFGVPDHVSDTIAHKGGQLVSRQDRPLSRAMRGELTDHEEFTYTLPSGVERVLLTSARAIRDKANTIVGAVQISLDISERKRGEEQRKLLVHELNHRVKNTLAVVQAVAAQTLRNASNMSEAASALASRLVSLAKAHDLLTRENWSGADLKDLVVAALEPHAALHRFSIVGDSVMLPSNLALSVALAFHELTTNAIKYGALSNLDGTVSISWTLTSQPDHRRLEIEWREEGGPPVVPADRKGFGTRMLERIIEPESGSVILTFKPAGLVCVFELKLGSTETNSSSRGEFDVKF